MRSMAWRHVFEPRPWSDLTEFYERMATKDQAFGYLVDIVRSIEASPSRDRLAATTSMHDLLVVDQPISTPPIEVLRVSAPGSLSPAPAGSVVIEHLSHNGRNDRVERPVVEAVPLFWRFALEKFGIEGAPVNEAGR
ncbi:MAG: hypothetical protein KF906_09780 [Actinobacteria bacterium]|nr:hypothetical protein [Actinomycetota bacterium]